MAATYLDSLIARRDKAAADLAAMASKPDYSIDGESFSHAANRAALLQEIKDLQLLIEQLQGPCWVTSYGH